MDPERLIEEIQKFPVIYDQTNKKYRNVDYKEQIWKTISSKSQVIDFGETLFVPEELPTLLSFLYTNIPPILKGTDSRVGLGFRIGPNADVQVQLELGPQQRTQPLGENANKRETEIPPFIPLGAPDSPGGWLNMWKTSFNEKTYSGIESNADPLSNSISVDRGTIQHLQQLYIEQPMEAVE